LEQANDLGTRIRVVEIRMDACERAMKEQKETLDSLDNSLDKIKSWLMGVMGGIIVSLILLIVNIIIAG